MTPHRGAGRRVGGPAPREDEGASPVVATILVVALTVALAVATYTAFTGFADGGEHAPAATFEALACEPAESAVRLQLTGRGPIHLDEVRLHLFNGSDEGREAATDPLDPDGGPWATGEALRVGPHDGPHPNWDGPLASPGGLQDGLPYRVDFVHKPSEATFSAVPFTC